MKRREDGRGDERGDDGGDVFSLYVECVYRMSFYLC